jgi:hypothetical protein
MPMRHSFLLATLALFAGPLHAAPGDDIPLVAIGLPFSPETPHPVTAKHPLYQRVAIGEIQGLPAVIGSNKLNVIGAARRSSVNAGLIESFREMEMLAPDASAAKFRLSASWIGSHMPFHIGTHNEATTTLHYQLTRIDNGQMLFERDITTAAEGGGVDAAMRDIEILRAAIAANFASAANCLDHAAYGNAPQDCTLTPKYAVSIERRR